MGAMDQPDRIHLRDFVVSAEIGAFQSERGRAQRLRFAIEAELAGQAAPQAPPATVMPLKKQEAAA